MYSAGHADIMKHKKDVGGESMLTLDMVREAQEALRGIARRTPLDRAPKFGENVYIKAENLQLTGAFKLRGAYNKIRSLTPEEAARGVIACSAGNHAQGIALSASRLGIKAVICMPAGAPISKVEATRGYGAEVVLVPGVYDDAAAEAEPEMAPNKALAPAFVTSSAPGSLPKMAMTKFTSRLAMPPWFIRLPAKMKKGMAVRLNLLMPTKMRWAPVTTEMSRGTVCKMVTREAMPME